MAQEPTSSSTAKRKREDDEADSHAALSVRTDCGAAATRASIEDDSEGEVEAGDGIVMRMATLAKCRSAMVESPNASRAVLLKHRAAIDSSTAKILEVVQDYKEAFTAIASHDHQMMSILLACSSRVFFFSWGRVELLRCLLSSFGLPIGRKDTFFPLSPSRSSQARGCGNGATPDRGWRRYLR